MADLILVTGPPGAGKTTVARLLADRFDPGVLVSGDAFYGFLGRGATPPWEPAARHQNEVTTRAAGAAGGQFAEGGFTVVFDGVVGPWLLPTFLAATGRKTIDYVILMPGEQQCLDRVASRIEHGFRDLAAARQMCRDFAAAAIEPRHVITEVGPPESIVEQITTRLAAGLLRTTS